ncbi:MAG: HD domain-containing protein [Bacteroidaceae bacterium]|nr:HD domain-containing protein [Bacteroidaceae bacterium]
MEKIIHKLQEYIEEEILPRYRFFDKAHDTHHATTVIEQSLQLATHYNVDINMVYTIAAFHDTGLCEGREQHHTVSAHIVRTDKFLRTIFTAEQIATIADAVEDHRASNKQPPRTIYGKIVAEADRLIDGETIMRRTIQYGLAHYPEKSRQEHYERACQHLNDKYGHNGYLQLWIPQSPNAERLQQFRRIIDDKESLLALFNRIFDEEKNS